MEHVFKIAAVFTGIHLCHEWFVTDSGDSPSVTAQELVLQDDRSTHHADIDIIEIVSGRMWDWAEKNLKCPSTLCNWRDLLVDVGQPYSVSWIGVCLLSVGAVTMLICKIARFCHSRRSPGAAQQTQHSIGKLLLHILRLSRWKSSTAFQESAAEEFALGATPCKALPGNAPPCKAPSGKARPPGKAPPGKAPPGKAPPGKAPPGKAPPGKAPPGKAPPYGKATAAATGTPQNGQARPGKTTAPPPPPPKNKASPKVKAPPPKGKASSTTGMNSAMGLAHDSNPTICTSHAKSECTPVFRSRIRWKELGEVRNTIFDELDSGPLSDEAVGVVRGLIERPTPKNIRPISITAKSSGDILIRDRDRAQKLAIHFRTGKHFDSLCAGLRTLDLKLPMEEEDFERLRHVWPTSEEQRMVKAFKGPREQLRDVEKCVMRLAEIPRADSRLRLLQFEKELRWFQAAFDSRMKVMQSACEELLGAPEWHTLLGEVLRMGNFINQGAGQRGVRGFTMDALLELKSLKGAGGASAATALHCLCVTCAHKDADFCEKLQKQLKSVPCAAQVTIQNFSEKLSHLRTSVDFAARELLQHRLQYELEDPVLMQKPRNEMENASYNIPTTTGLLHNVSPIPKEETIPGCSLTNSPPSCFRPDAPTESTPKQEIAENTADLSFTTPSPNLRGLCAPTADGVLRPMATPQRRRGTAAVITPVPLSKPPNARVKVPSLHMKSQRSPFVKHFELKSSEFGDRDDDGEEETSTVCDEDSSAGKEEEHAFFEPYLDVPSSDQVREALKAGGMRSKEQSIELEALANALESPIENVSLNTSIASLDWHTPAGCNVELMPSFCNGNDSDSGYEGSRKTHDYSRRLAQEFNHGDDNLDNDDSNRDVSEISGHEAALSDSDSEDDHAKKFAEQHCRLEGRWSTRSAKVHKASTGGQGVAKPLTWKMAGSDSESYDEDAASDASDGSKWYSDTSGIDDPWLCGVSARWPQTWQRKSQGGYWRTGTPCETPGDTPLCTPRDVPFQSTPRISSRLSTPRSTHTPRRVNTPRTVNTPREGRVTGARAKVFGTPNGGRQEWIKRTCSNYSEPTLETESVNVCSGDFSIPLEDYSCVSLQDSTCASFRNETIVDQMQQCGARRRLEILTCEGHLFTCSAEEQLSNIAEAARLCQQYFGVCTDTGKPNDDMQLFSIVAQFLGNFRTAWQQVLKNEKWSKFLPKSLQKAPASSRTTPRTARNPPMSGRSSVLSARTSHSWSAKDEEHRRECLSARETTSCKSESKCRTFSETMDVEENPCLSARIMTLSAKAPSIMDEFYGRRHSVPSLSKTETVVTPRNHEKLAVLAESPMDGEKLYADN